MAPELPELIIYKFDEISCLPVLRLFKNNQSESIQIRSVRAVIGYVSHMVLSIILYYCYVSELRKIEIKCAIPHEVWNDLLNPSVEEIGATVDSWAFIDSTVSLNKPLKSAKIIVGLNDHEGFLVCFGLLDNLLNGSFPGTYVLI